MIERAAKMVPNRKHPKVVNISHFMASSREPERPGREPPNDAPPDKIQYGEWASPEDFLDKAQQAVERSKRWAQEAAEAQTEHDLASPPSSPHDSGMTGLSREELDAKLDRTESRVDAAIARLETQFGGFRGELKAESRNNSRMQHLTLAVIGLLAVVTIGGMTLLASQMTSSESRMGARMDRLEHRMDALPGELRGIADSITSAITATQSGQPPAIVIERPAEPPAPQE